MPFEVSSGWFCTWNQNAADFKSKGFYDPASCSGDTSLWADITSR